MERMKNADKHATQRVYDTRQGSWDAVELKSRNVCLSALKRLWIYVHRGARFFFSSAGLLEAKERERERQKRWEGVRWVYILSAQLSVNVFVLGRTRDDDDDDDDVRAVAFVPIQPNT